MDQRKANANAANANADETLELPGELESELSIADISKLHSNPKRWVLYFAILLVAVVVPYWAGRTLAVQHTAWVVKNFSGLSAQGVVFIAWVTTVATATALAMALIESSRWLWRFLFVVFLTIEQFISGLCLLRLSFLVFNIRCLWVSKWTCKCCKSWNNLCWIWRCCLCDFVCWIACNGS